MYFISVCLFSWHLHLVDFVLPKMCKNSYQCRQYPGRYLLWHAEKRYSISLMPQMHNYDGCVKHLQVIFLQGKFSEHGLKCLLWISSYEQKLCIKLLYFMMINLFVGLERGLWIILSCFNHNMHWYINALGHFETG